MRRSLTITTLVLTAWLLPGMLARAEPDTAEPTAARSYDFEDELVSGDLVSPYGELLKVRRPGTRASLVEVRTSYLDKLIRSIEDL